MRRMMKCVRWRISLSDLASSLASQLLQGLVYTDPLWERACSRRCQPRQRCIHCMKTIPQTHLPQPRPNSEKPRLSFDR